MYLCLFQFKRQEMLEFSVVPQLGQPVYIGKVKGLFVEPGVFYGETGVVGEKGQHPDVQFRYGFFIEYIVDQKRAQDLVLCLKRYGNKVICPKSLRQFRLDLLLRLVACYLKRHPLQYGERQYAHVLSQGDLDALCEAVELRLAVSLEVIV